MRLVRIRFERCGEVDWDGDTWVFAPKMWSQSDIDEKVKDAEKLYLQAVDTAKDNIGEPPRGDINMIWNTDVHNDRTLGELKEYREELIRKREAWEAERAETEKKFEHFLEQAGFVPVWSDEAKNEYFEVTVDWGHKHGVRIIYGDRPMDSSHPPAQTVDPAWEQTF